MRHGIDGVEKLDLLRPRRNQQRVLVVKGLIYLIGLEQRTARTEALVISPF